MSLDDWNERYRTREKLDDEPASLLVEAARDLAPGRALDLACGAGRNAIWLARNGWDVVAIDGAAEAIRIVREREPRIDARVQDLETNDQLPFDDESFDLVAVLYFLHRPLFAEAKRLVRRGGIVIAAARMSSINPKYCVAPGELGAHFSGWEVLLERHEDPAEVVVRQR